MSRNRAISDPLARSNSGVIGADAPLFAPREVEPPKHVFRKPIAATSIAAHQPAAVHRSSDERRVLELCKRPEGITIDEAAVAMGKACNEISGRFNSLELKGLIGRAAITRLTRRGRRADVWKALPKREVGTL